MSFSLDRRRFLGTGPAGAAIVAFDPVRAGWVTAAEAAGGTPRGAVAVPELDGELTTDPAALAAAADDFGHLVHRTPLAVLRPGSVGDVVALVRYANRHGIAVSMRGQGHSTNGQSQVHAGVVIDSSTLDQVHEIEADRVTADAGVLWIDLARATLAHGLTPPVFTDYLDLSVGGTLNAGGIGGTTQRVGMQVDNVLALEVVTGRAATTRRSPPPRRRSTHAACSRPGRASSARRADPVRPADPARGGGRGVTKPGRSRVAGLFTAR